MSAAREWHPQGVAAQGISAPIRGIVDHALDSSDPRECEGCKSGQCNREKVWPTTALLSDHGNPRACPACGGISIFASHLAMEGRACRYTARARLVVAFYCAEYTRQHERRDVSLDADGDLYMMGSWNGEAMEAVKGMAADVVRVVGVARGFVNDLGDHARLRTLVDELRGDLCKADLDAAKAERTLAKADATIKRLRDAAKRSRAAKRKAGRK